MAKNFLTSIFGSRNDRLLKQYRRVVEQVNALEPKLEKLSDEQLKAKTQEFRDRIAKGESLDDLERPERIAQIKADHDRRVARLAARRRINPLRPDDASIDLDEVYGQAKACLTCHK